MAAGTRRVVWGESAQAALDEALSGIAESSLDGAIRVMTRAIEVADSLSTLAERGRVVPEIGESTLRELFVYEYRLLYRVRALGRQPKYGEIQKPLSAFSVGVYEGRFGSWRKALEAFVAQIGGEVALEQVGGSKVPPLESKVHTRAPDVQPVRKTSRGVNWRLRFLVMQRDGFRCCKCGSSPAKGHTVSLQVDHVFPWSKGGETTIANLQTLCETCNVGKSNLGHEPSGA